MSDPQPEAPGEPNAARAWLGRALACAAISGPGVSFGLLGMAGGSPAGRMALIALPGLALLAAGALNLRAFMGAGRPRGGERWAWNGALTAAFAAMLAVAWVAERRSEGSPDCELPPVQAPQAPGSEEEEGLIQLRDDAPV